MQKSWQNKQRLWQNFDYSTVYTVLLTHLFQKTSSIPLPIFLPIPTSLQTSHSYSFPLPGEVLSLWTPCFSISRISTSLYVLLIYLLYLLSFLVTSDSFLLSSLLPSLFFRFFVTALLYILTSPFDSDLLSYLLLQCTVFYILIFPLTVLPIPFLLLPISDSPLIWVFNPISSH
jgi:hypothetical protein